MARIALFLVNCTWFVFGVIDAVRGPLMDGWKDGTIGAWLFCLDRGKEDERGVLMTSTNELL